MNLDAFGSHPRLHLDCYHIESKKRSDLDITIEFDNPINQFNGISGVKALRDAISKALDEYERQESALRTSRASNPQ